VEERRQAPVTGFGHMWMANTVPNKDEPQAYLPVPSTLRCMLVKKPAAQDWSKEAEDGYSAEFKKAHRSLDPRAGGLRAGGNVKPVHKHVMWPSTSSQHALLYNVEFSGEHHGGGAYNWWYNGGKSSTSPALIPSEMPAMELQGLQKCWSALMEEAAQQVTGLEVADSGLCMFSNERMWVFDWRDPAVEHKLGTSVQIYIHSANYGNRGLQ